MPCSSGKRTYSSRRSARRASSRQHGSLVAYRCDICGRYHLTSHHRQRVFGGTQGIREFADRTAPSEGAARPPLTIDTTWASQIVRTALGLDPDQENDDDDETEHLR